MDSFKIEETDHFRIHYGWRHSWPTGTRDEPREDKAHYLYVEVLRPFDAGDFTALITSPVETYDRTRSVAADYYTTLNTPASKEWIKLLMDCGLDFDSWQLYRDVCQTRVRGAVRETWHHKGCRTDAQKEQRRSEAQRKVRDKIRDTRSLGRELILAFNTERVERVVKFLNENYVKAMGRNLGSIDNDWLKTNVGRETLIELVEHETRAHTLQGQMNALREQSREAHERLRALQRAAQLDVLERDGWEVNGVVLPEEAQRAVRAELQPEGEALEVNHH